VQNARQGQSSKTGADDGDGGVWRGGRGIEVAVHGVSGTANVRVNARLLVEIRLMSGETLADLAGVLEACARLSCGAATGAPCCNPRQPFFAVFACDFRTREFHGSFAARAPPGRMRPTAGMPSVRMMCQPARGRGLGGEDEIPVSGVW